MLPGLVHDSAAVGDAQHHGLGAGGNRGLDGHFLETDTDALVTEAMLTDTGCGSPFGDPPGGLGTERILRVPEEEQVGLAYFGNAHHSRPSQAWVDNAG